MREREREREKGGGKGGIRKVLKTRESKVDNAS